MDGPALASPEFDDIVARYSLTMLRSGDFSIADGDLALTKDGDLMMGDVPYNALFRLVEHWRHNTPHLAFLYSLISTMKDRQSEADERLNEAAEVRSAQIRSTGSFEQTPEFLEAWHAHYGEEGSAVMGRHTYSGCLTLLTSNALLRFKSDLDAPEPDWQTSGQLFGGHSVGQIVVAAANGFRHEDEWAKARPPSAKQKRSQDVLRAALGERDLGDFSPPGRCPETIALLSIGRGFEGFSATILSFAHEIAVRRKAALGRT